MKVPDVFLPEKNLEKSLERMLNKEAHEKTREYTKFEVIHVDTYSKGIANLGEQCRKPFTFAENVEARITDYELNGESVELFNTFLSSVTGIAYKAKSTKFKIVLRSNKLENIQQEFNKNFVPNDYGTEQGIEFDSKKGKYDKLLTRKEAKNHEFWIAVMNCDKEKLAKYVDIWFDKTGEKEGMGIYLRSNTDEDELRALVLVKSDSIANGENELYFTANFVLGVE